MTLAALVVGLLLHEYAHAVIATAMGDATPELAGRLTLQPLVHVHPVGSVALPFLLFALGLPVVGTGKPMPIGRRLTHAQAILVLFAGPLMNVLLALAVFPLWWAFPPALEWTRVNLLLAGFNLLPLPWLDGGRMLRTFLRAVI